MNTDLFVAAERRPKVARGETVGKLKSKSSPGWGERNFL